MLEQIQVQADKYDQQIMEQTEKYDKQIMEIKTELVDIKSKYTEIKVRNDVMQRSYDDVMQRSYDDVMQRSYDDVMQRSYDVILIQNKAIQCENEAISADNAKIKEQLQKYEGQLTELTHKYESIAVNNQVMRNYNRELREPLDGHSERLKNLEVDYNNETGDIKGVQLYLYLLHTSDI